MHLSYLSSTGHSGSTLKHDQKRTNCGGTMRNDHFGGTSLRKEVWYHSPKVKVPFVNSSFLFTSKNILLFQLAVEGEGKVTLNRVLGERK